MSPKRYLYVWDGDFGLPSIEAQCITLMSYIRMKNLKNVSIRKTNNPLYRTIPSLKDERTIMGFSSILQHLQTLSGTNGKDKKETRADTYGHYAISKLEPALQLLMWCNLENYYYLTRVWYKNAMPYLFFNGMIVDRRRQRILNYWEAMAANCFFHDFSEQILKEAILCINDLSEVLGDDNYFFHSKNPTTLDAIIFGYLSVIYKIPIPSSLKETAESLPNLTRFVDNVTKSYFKDVPDSYKYIKKQTNDEEKVPTKQIIFAGLVAATTMILYAYVQGIIRVSIN